MLRQTWDYLRPRGGTRQQVELPNQLPDPNPLISDSVTKRGSQSWDLHLLGDEVSPLTAVRAGPGGPGQGLMPPVMCLGHQQSQGSHMKITLAILKQELKYSSKGELEHYYAFYSSLLFYF